MILLWISLAGGLGGASRYLVDSGVRRLFQGRFPLGTFVVNVSACLLLGVLTGYVVAHPAAGDLQLILGTGFLGGYSTFSTACVEGMQLLRTSRRRAALLHTFGMLLAGLAAALIGLTLGALL